MKSKTNPSEAPPRTKPPAAAPGDIALFIRTVELGSFSAVAREQNAPASNISRAVSRLENQYGVRLLRRSTHNLSLTPEGKAVLDYGRQALMALDRLAEEIMAPREQISGTVRVALSAAVAEFMVIPGLPRLHQQHPELRLELLTDDRPVDLTMEGVDLALRTGQVVNELLVAREVGHFRRGLYCAPRYRDAHGLPAHPDELIHHTIISHLSVHPLNPLRFMIHGELVEKQLPAQFSSNTTALVGQLVLAGLGIGNLTAHLAAPWVAQGRLMEVLPDYRVPGHQPIYVVMPADRLRLPRIKAVADFLTEQVRLSTGE